MKKPPQRVKFLSTAIILSKSKTQDSISSQNYGNSFSRFQAYRKISVFDNVAFAMRVIGISEKSVRKRVEYILGLVGLSEKAGSKPSELSGGEQQRVSLARALVNNPELIIADEPTGNIDPELSYEIMELLVEINKRGTTVLIVTHEHNLVNEFGGRIIKINGGKIVGDYIREVEQ